MDSSSSSTDSLALMSDAPDALRVKVTITNEPLSDAEIALFNAAVLCKLEAQLGEADEQISDLQATLSAIQAKRKRLSETVNVCRGMLSLMRGFPTDVLVEIFKWYCKGFDVFHTKAGPWHLAQVCSRWRRVVFSTPVLWSNFRLNSVADVKVSRESMHMLRTCLAQSASVPLTISFHMRSEDSDPASAARRATFRLNLELLNMVMEHSERWREIDLIILPGLMTLLDNVLGKLPLLETLSLQARFKDVGEIDFPIVAGFRIAPRLTSVTLMDVVIERIHLPLPQLEDLYFKWVHDGIEQSMLGTSMSRLHYLVDCPALQILKIVHPLPDDEDHPPPFPTALVANQSVRVLHASDVRFVESVILPSLKELRIVPIRHTWDNTRSLLAMTTSIVGLLNRSQCPLEILDVMDIADTPFATVDILTLTPRLQELHLNYNSWSEDVDAQLANLFHACAEALVPNLRVLSITATDSPSQPCVVHFIGPSLDYFVHYRWCEPGPGVSQIAKISIQLMMPVMLERRKSGQDEALMRCLKQYKRDGLDISITTIGVFPPPLLGGDESHEFVVSRIRGGQTQMIYV